MVTKRSRSNMNQRTTPTRRTRDCEETSTGRGSVVSTVVTAVTSLWLWGCNCFGQLGFGDEIWGLIRPTLSFFGEKILDAAVGGMHTVVIAADSSLWSFGANRDGALGRKTQETGDDEGESSVPEKVEWPEAAGNPAQVACTESGTFVLTEAGAIYGWGTFKDSTGIIGFSPTVKVQRVPICIYKPNRRQPRATKLVAGGNHIIALLEDGSALSWGDGSEGQLGRITMRHSRREKLRKRNMLTPTVIKAFRGLQFVDASCGAFTTILKTSSGQFFGFGLNNYGQLGEYPKVGVARSEDLTFEERVEKEVIFLSPTKLEALELYGIANVDIGKHHSLGLTKDGEVLSWGAATHGVLGNEEVIPLLQDSTFVAPPSYVSGLPTPMCSVACGEAISGCVSADGDLYSWGACIENMLGTNASEDLPTPTKIRRTQAMQDKKFFKLEFGAQHSMAIAEDFETPKKRRRE